MKDIPVRRGPIPYDAFRKRRLSPLHAKVVTYYMRGMSRAEALRKAGYSEWAAAASMDVFGRPDVIREINRRKDQLTEKAQIDAQWVIDRLVSIANADLGDLLELDENSQPTGKYDLSKLTPQLSRALGEVSMDEMNYGRGSHRVPVKRLRIKMVDKLRALEMLAKHVGMFEATNKLSVEVALIDRLQEGRSGKEEEDE